MIEDKPLSSKANRVFARTVDSIIEPITVTELKDFARIDGSDEDIALDTFISAARQAAEEYTGRAFIEQTWRMSLDWWENYVIELPRPPLLSISSVETISESGVATTYSSSYYFSVTDGMFGKLVIKNDYSLPSNYDRDVAGYRITFKAGYGSMAMYVPVMIRTAIKQWATAIYESRAMTPEPPPDVKLLLNPYRIIKL